MAKAYVTEMNDYIQPFRDRAERKAAHDSYIKGIVDTVHDRIRPPEVVPTGRGLILVNTKAVAIQDFLGKNFPSLRRLRSRSSRIDIDHYASGKHDGKDVNLSRGNLS